MDISHLVSIYYVSHIWIDPNMLLFPASRPIILLCICQAAPVDCCVHCQATHDGRPLHSPTHRPPTPGSGDTPYWQNTSTAPASALHLVLSVWLHPWTRTRNGPPGLQRPRRLTPPLPPSAHMATWPAAAVRDDGEAGRYGSRRERARLVRGRGLDPAVPREEIHGRTMAGKWRQRRRYCPS